MARGSIKYKSNRSKYRGSRVCGWGIQGQHRGSGKNGGFGHAGGCKHRRSWIIHYYGANGYWGKHGFHRPTVVVKKVNPINIKDMEIKLPELEKAGAAVKKGTHYEIDLGQIGYNKLLSTGNVNGKYNITVEMASAKAVEKISGAGGSVTVTEAGSDEE
nr:uL15 family ribosomal protein [Candidatus Sigynarchaeota archaeon]